MSSSSTYNINKNISFLLTNEHENLNFNMKNDLFLFKSKIIRTRTEMNTTTLNRKILNEVYLSPKTTSSKDKLSLFGKKLFGRVLEFDFSDKKIFNSTEIKQSSIIAQKTRKVQAHKPISFYPDFTSTPTYDIPKTSTPTKSKQVVKQTKLTRNSTFKDGIKVPFSLFASKVHHHGANVFTQDRVYKKVKTVQTTKNIYISKVKEEYYHHESQKRTTCACDHNLVSSVKQSTRAKNNAKLTDLNLYYSEKKFQELKCKLIRRNLWKSKQVKRLSCQSDSSENRV